MPTDPGRGRRRGFEGPFVGDPHWSPDGRAIAFSSHADGNPDIYLMRCEQGAATCSEPRQLTRTPASDANPTWSADGRWIYFSSSRSGDYGGDYEVWRMPADGGAPERMTWNGGYMARESADGKWLYYSKHVYPTTGFWRIALPARGLGSRKRWSRRTYRTGLRPPGRWHAGVVLLPCRNPRYGFRQCEPSIWKPDAPGPSGGKHTPCEGLSLSPDGRWLVRSRSTAL